MNTERGTERVNFNGSVEFSDAILWSPPGDLFRLPTELYLTLTLKVIYPAKIYSAGPFVFTKRPASHSRNFKHLHPGSTNDTTGLLLMNSWEAHIVYAVVGKGVFIDFFDLILVCACFHTIQCALLIALYIFVLSRRELTSDGHTSKLSTRNFQRYSELSVFMLW